MALKNFHPKRGMILMCNFDTGFKEPEMVKERPVILLHNPRQKLVTVAPLSTTAPAQLAPFHFYLDKKYLPNTSFFQRNSGCWVKGDMVYTVGFHRLTQIKIIGAGGRDTFFTRKLGKEIMAEVHRCVLHGLDIGYLSAPLFECKDSIQNV